MAEVANTQKAIIATNRFTRDRETSESAKESPSPTAQALALEQAQAHLAVPVNQCGMNCYAPVTRWQTCVLSSLTLETTLKQLCLSGLCQTLSLRVQKPAANRLGHAEFSELIMKD